MSKTKHLDTAIAIFKADGVAKRAPRKAQAELALMWGSNIYTITVNGKTVETGEGTQEYARQRMQARADAIRKLGKTVVTHEY